VASAKAGKRIIKDLYPKLHPEVEALTDAKVGLGLGQGCAQEDHR
jgi:hypothetical protein